MRTGGQREEDVRLRAVRAGVRRQPPARRLVGRGALGPRGRGRGEPGAARGSRHGEGEGEGEEEMTTCDPRVPRRSGLGQSAPPMMIVASAAASLTPPNR